MAARGQTNDWRELREFSGVDLENSFVLSWSVAADVLTIDMDVCLHPQHPFYESPRPSERACIRPGMLEFPYCTSLWRQDAGESSRHPKTVAGTLRHGKVSGLTRVGDGLYEMHGAFGRILIESERPLLRFGSSTY